MNQHDGRVTQGSADFTVNNQGSIFLLDPISEEAVTWAEDYLTDAQRFGNTVVVEHRYIADIVEGINGDGLSVVEV